MKLFHSFILLLALLFFACAEKKEEQIEMPTSWEKISATGKDRPVTLMMWQGDPLINDYMQEHIVPAVKEQFGIELNIVPGQGNTIVSNLMTELEAGKAESELDLLWINGETFFQLRQINALHGPFVDLLPNSKYINWENPFIAYDFQQKVDGYECPWGNVQMCIIYDSTKVQSPPQSPEDFESFVKEHPGKFSIGNDFTGMTLLKSWLIYFAGGRDKIAGDFNEELYQQAGEQLFDFLNRIKPYLWNEGKSFPNNVAQMHQLYANGELWFTMSNNDSEVDNKVSQGIFPESSRAYVPESGSIQNSHYLGIPANSGNKEAAMMVVNYMISPEAQYLKMQPEVWGDGTVLATDKLPQEWQLKFQDIPGRNYAPNRDEIREHALMEPAPEYMIRLFEDFRTKVVEAN